jgi:hypothetical protein
VVFGFQHYVVDDFLFKEIIYFGVFLLEVFQLALELLQSIAFDAL